MGAGARLAWPPAAPELAAGVALAAAIALKASAAILLPVILVGLLRAPRRLVQVVVGLTVGGIVLGVGTVVAFGLHLPDLGAQGRLVIPMGLPNLLGLVLGQEGETETLRSLLSVVLVAAVIGCSVLAWRRRDALTASGWATMALLLTLSWVLPWYVLWVLPLAALSRSRALRTTALMFGAYLLLTWMPLATGLDNALGIRPTTTLLGSRTSATSVGCWTDRLVGDWAHIENRQAARDRHTPSKKCICIPCARGARGEALRVPPKPAQPWSIGPAPAAPGGPPTALTRSSPSGRRPSRPT